MKKRFRYAFCTLLIYVFIVVSILLVCREPVDSVDIGLICSVLGFIFIDALVSFEE